MSLRRSSSGGCRELTVSDIKKQKETSVGDVSELEVPILVFHNPRNDKMFFPFAHSLVDSTFDPSVQSPFVYQIKLRVYTECKSMCV